MNTNIARRARGPVTPVPRNASAWRPEVRARRRAGETRRVRGSSWPCPAGCTRPTYYIRRRECGHDGLTFGPPTPATRRDVGRVKPAGFEVRRGSVRRVAPALQQTRYPASGKEKAGPEGPAFRCNGVA